MEEIRETTEEFCVIADYKDGGNFCMAKFMHEEDARDWQEQQPSKEWVTYRLYKRCGRVIDDEVRWEPLEE